ncbi:MAG: hypothetical protein AAGC79_00395 [Pseudomonadota bacterium]
MIALRTITAIALPLMLANCGTVGLFGTYDVPESPEVADAEWPRLVDVPEAPAVGEYSTDIPDPAIGTALISDLGSVAQDASTRAAGLSGPVLTEADRRRLGLN